MRIKTIARGLVVACCAALGLNAWAADIEITNVGKIVHPTGGSVGVNVGTYPIAGLHIAADSSLGIANGDVLKIKKIAIAYNDNGTYSATHHLQLAGINSAEKTTDESMAIGSESVATYVFNETVYAIVGATTQLRTLTADGTGTNFRCRVYDHQDATQVAQLRSIVSSSNYASTNYGAMYRVVAEKVPAYTKGSLTAYINKNSAQTLIPGATLADIAKGKVIGQVNGDWISAAFKNNLIEPFNVTEVKDEGTQKVTSITMQFQLKESRNLVKAVLAECTETADGVVIKAVDAKANQQNDHYGEDASSWTTSTVATSDGAGGYGIHNLTFVVPYKPIYAVETSKTYAELNVEAPAAGDKAAIYVSKDAVLTFANETIPTGVEIIAEDATAGIKVAGTIPAALYANTKMTIVGSATMPTDLSVSGTTLSLAGGTLSGSDSARFHVVGDMTIPVSGESAISNIWMGNNNTRRTLTLDVAEDATMTIGKIVNNYSHTILKDGEGVLKVTSNVSNKQVSYQLKAGSIVAKAGETSIEPHSSVSGMVIVESEADTDGYTTYTLGLAPRTEATTIYAVDFDCSGFKLEDGTATTMIDGDVVVFPADCGTAGQWKGDGSKLVAGHEVVVNKELNWKSSVGTMTIGTGATVYYYEGTINEGASISGAGTLKIFNSKTLTGDVTITTAIVFADGEVYADPNVTLTLSADATLTVPAELAAGKVLSAVEGKHAEYTDGKYVLVDDAPDAPTATVTEITEGLPADIDAAYVFTIGEAVEGYEDYDANFEVSFNRAIAKDSVVLKGSYGAYLWQQIDMPKDLAAGEVWTLLPAGTVNYGEVMNNVVEFTCGVKNYAAANAGATMTVKLVLTKEGEEKVVMSTTTYTLTHEAATIGGLEATDTTPVETIVPLAQAEKLTAAGVKAPAITSWASKHGVTTLVGQEINVDAFVLDVAPTTTEEKMAEIVANEITAEMIADLAADGTADLSALEVKYPYADISMKEVTTQIAGEGATNTHLYKLVIELKK